MLSVITKCTSCKHFESHEFEGVREALEYSKNYWRSPCYKCAKDSKVIYRIVEGDHE